MFLTFLVLWKFKLLTDDIVMRIGFHIISKYWCCTRPQRKTISHVFFTSELAQKVWNHLAKDAGIHGIMVQLHKVIRLWGGSSKPLYKDVPAMIVCQIWK